MPAMGPPAARSLPLSDWPLADRTEWASACRPGVRMQRGGRASHLKPVTRDDLSRRYGYFLGFLARSGRLDLNAAAGAQVSPGNVDAFVTELRTRVGSVTLYASVHKLRQATQLIAPDRDVSWLRPIESDLALMRKGRSKYERLVLAEVLVKAGLALMAEADAGVDLAPLRRARQFRNGLMIALLACCPIRLKNFAALTIGGSLVQIGSAWWIVLDATETKEGRQDERPVPGFLTTHMDRYVSEHTLVLGISDGLSSSLWLSTRGGQPMCYGAVEAVVCRTTEATVGVKVSPHAFRTSAATSAAMHAGAIPHLASAVLAHRNPVVTQEHYNRASALSAGKAYLEVIGTYSDLQDR